MKKELEEKFKNQKERDFQEKIEEYYHSEIRSVFENESKKAEYVSIAIFDKAFQRLISKGEKDLQKKLENLNLQAKKLNVEKQDIEEEMKKNTNILEELKNYETWIEEWVIEDEGL